MPVVKVESSLVPGLGYDRRFKQWGKVIRSAAQIDLNEKQGFALLGPFTKWGEAVGLDEAQFLVLGSQTGSVAHHSYAYALVECMGGQPHHVDDSLALGAVEAANVFTSEQLAKAQNSPLYSYACYMWLCFMARMSTGDLLSEVTRQGLEYRYDESAPSELAAELTRQGLDSEAPSRYLNKMMTVLTGADFRGVLHFPVAPARRLLDAVENPTGEQFCPLCDQRIRHAERICRRCLDQTIRELDSLDTATACKAAAEYAIQRVTS